MRDNVLSLQHDAFACQVASWKVYGAIRTIFGLTAERSVPGDFLDTGKRRRVYHPEKNEAKSRAII